METCELTFSIVTPPSHGTLSVITDQACTLGTPNSDTSTVTYTPDANYHGPDSFTYKVHDTGDGSSPAVDSDPATVTITVTAVNHAPTTADDAYSVAEDVTLTVPAPGVLGNDSDADVDPLTAALVSNVGHGALTLNTNGAFTYTPNANFNGPDSFTYKANDGQADSNVATVTIVVTPVIVGQPGQMTGGGSVFTGVRDTPPGGIRVTHGFELHCDKNDLPNNLKINWKNATGEEQRFHLDVLTSVICTNDPLIHQRPPVAPLDTLIGTGTGLYNGVAGARICFTFVDAGEPGKDDSAKYLIFTGGGTCAAPIGVVPRVDTKFLDVGNHQAHKE